MQNGQDKPNYCLQCAEHILRLAHEHLDALDSRLSDARRTNGPEARERRA